MDRVRKMQKQIQKYVDEKNAAGKSEKETKPTGLLARRTSDVRKEDVKGNSSPQKDNERIIADYITKIRNFKEEILNG